MSQLIERLADLTGLRDRGILDAMLTSTISDLLHPRSVAIYRVVGQGEDRRWTTRARQARGELIASGDPSWVPMQELPLLGEHPLRCAALSGEVVCDEDASASLSIFALATDRETAGVMEIVSDAPPDAAAQQLVCGLLRIYRNFQCLLDYSERDTLTGLLNRKTFDETFFKVMHETPGAACAVAERRCGRRDPGEAWLAMVDIDFFKSVNDGFGHLIGDEVLLLLARLMRGTLRFDDRLYRFGGEEFVILMHCDGVANAASSLERLRRNTEAYAFPRVGRLTISIGFTAILASDSPSSALERADQAVYHAKASGRNRVCSHSELVANGLARATENIGEIEIF